jgi:hypothetical protein
MLYDGIRISGTRCGASGVLGRTLMLSFRLLLFFLAFLAVPCVSSAELLDRIVASVNRYPITWSELNQAVEFNIAVGGGGGAHLPARTLEGLINRRLLVQEAHRLKFVEVSEDEIAGEVRELRERLGPDAAFAGFLERLDITVEQLGRMLGERLLVERFIERKLGLFIRVTRDEAEQYFNAHADRFRGKRFQEVQKEIVAEVQAQRLDEQLVKYIGDLRGRAEIKVTL